MAKHESANGTQAVDRASALLVEILKAPTPTPLAKLAKQSELPKSTTSRILSALERQGLLQRDQHGGFFAGHILTSFAREQNLDSILALRMRPILESLAMKTGETANLATAGHGYINLLDQVDGQYLLGATNWIGKRVPYHASALGKVLLAFNAAPLPTGRLEKKTEKTITSRTKLLAELDRVRSTGYAIIQDELEEGLVAVAAPIRESSGKVIGAISISGPSPRLSEKDLHRIGRMIVAEVQNLAKGTPERPERLERPERPERPERNEKTTAGKAGRA